MATFFFCERNKRRRGVAMTKQEQSDDVALRPSFLLINIRRLQKYPHESTQDHVMTT
jgi:hypothetical protein